MANLSKIFMPLLGKRLLDIRAARAMVVLLELAIERRIITYGDMAKRLAMRNPRHVVAVISLAGEVIEQYFKDECPEICSLVVGKTTRMPGNGYFKYEPEQARFLALTPKEKQAYFTVLQNEVFNFKRWRELLPLAQDFCKYYL